jgi:hypothetical protein
MPRCATTPFIAMHRRAPEQRRSLARSDRTSTPRSSPVSFITKRFTLNVSFKYITLHLEPLRRTSSRRRRTPTHTPLITTPLLKPFARAHIELAVQLSGRFLAMYEVAETAANAPFAAVETTTSFAKIGDRRKFAVNRATSIPATVERIARFLAVFFVLEAHVHVANKICRKTC